MPIQAAGLRRPKVPGWTRPTKGPHVEIVMEEVGDGIFQVMCRCGATVSAPFGLEHAKMRARRHLICNGVRVPDSLWDDDGP